MNTNLRELVHQSSPRPTDTQQHNLLLPDNDPFRHSKPTTTNPEVSGHLLHDGNLYMREITPKVFSELPAPPSFTDEVFENANGLSPNLLASESLRGWMQSKTPEFPHYFGTNIFQENVVGYGDQVAAVLTPENLSEDPSNYGPHTSGNDYVEPSSQPPSMGGDLSEWQAGLVDDDVGSFLQKASSGHFNSMGMPRSAIESAKRRR